MEINVRSRDGVQVMQLKGDLKLGPAVDSFRQAVDESFNAGSSKLVLNVSEVPMIDSSGIGALVRVLTSAKQRGGGLKLVNPSKQALQTLKIVGLLNLFEVYPEEGEAVSSFGG